MGEMLSKPLRLPLVIAILSCSSAISIFAEQLSPRSVPLHFFNDYAGVVNSDTAAALNQRLADFERETSNQLMVVIYPKYTAKTSLEDYAQQAYRAWKLGQAGRDNGAILFLFVQDRKIRIHTGRGLEGALPDATGIRIMNEIAPYFREQDFDTGLTAGVNAIIAATKDDTSPKLAENIAPDESLTNATEFRVEQADRPR